MTEIQKATIKRVLSAVVALPVYVFTIVTDLGQSVPMLACSLIVTLACLYEYYSITDRGEEGRAFVKTGMVFAVVVNIIMYLFAYGKLYGYSRYIPAFDARVVLGVISVFMVAMMALQLFTRPLKGAAYSMGVTLFGVLYIVFFFSHVILLKSLADGVYYIILLNIVVMLNDTMAYFGGVLFGKHKTGFPVSPNKSWEGYFSGLLFSVLAMVITNEVYAAFFDRHLFGMIEAVLLGVALSVLGNLGDLIESAVKRDGSIKDSGSIIPGHGGMWDVFDALIFSMPLFYYYLMLKGVA
ncbi:MAG TPA: phosphatidate cytidylyltransferase [Spirochaetota bacterium]|nr:phosphatidate cytidylyltransferase [Spirochaetota bacterium]HOD13295.1 phosphatidate cytidylyltransferase [Spirochaetota bacterium]HPG51124.1 phosphatidate cytidylyltransferase [Spirochaetota bacterium]HPN10792.1 phosphatidate cytidylyltransferase [Spirochaetota bacterium]HQL83754.1 phosphatidate cytidylyltransferase [Spirochaetota bacterium]